jgi:citrate/tricarballylate utilization protein
MERQSLFAAGDLGYLANLCHDCRGCYQACMYTEPHEFAINIPVLMSHARMASYERYARPRLLARLFEHSAAWLCVLTFVALALVIAGYALFGQASRLWGTSSGPDSLYRVVSHAGMAVPAVVLSFVVLGTAAWGFVVFMGESAVARRDMMSPRLWGLALRQAATLRWMRGGGGDCYFPDAERPSRARRVLHHLVAYGFLSAFLATVCAAAMEYLLGERPPYSLASAPVILGTLGGVGILAGACGFLVLNRRDTRQLAVASSASLDSAFLAALILVCMTGIAVLVTQKSVGVVHVVLLAHLATIIMFYITVPYGKMMHAVYRFGALVRYARDTAAEL